ncbi:MAG: peptidoglycan DD-metalloendopeptidase family protein [Chitinispirillaceae bacterium]|nr:peptidoglycan DD-metalloendopeptidase family protein [Chitinispirillaceae bacterium]
MLSCFIVSSPFAGIVHIHPGMNLEILPDRASSITDLQEQRFQEYINTLLASDGKSIDTTGWCTYRINCARFDYRHLSDTLRIPLVDSSKNRFFTYPLKNFVTSPFGPRRQFWHFGTDIQVKYRDTIRCAFDGIVRVVLNDRYGYGKVVVVRHHFGLETLYAHLSSTMVSNNQEVKSGDVIGRGGRTGRATGSHLHFEIRFCGEPFDPAYLLDVENYSLKSDTLVLSRATFDYIGDIRKTVVYKIRPGDNLGRIARKYGTTVNKLCRLNGITPKTILKIGRRLVVRKEDTPEFFSGNKQAGGKGS